MSSNSTENRAANLVKRKRKPTATAQKAKKDGRRIWCDYEVELILDYMIYTVKGGNKIEKPNAVAYYTRMQSVLELENCDVKSITNKIRGSLKPSYDKAVEWKNHTGQGIEDETTVREEIIKRCKFFDRMDEIYCFRASSNPPYVSDSHDGASQQSIGSLDLDESDDELCLSPSSSNSSRSRIDKRPKAKKHNLNPELQDLISKRCEVQREEISFQKEELSLKKKLLEEDLNERNTKYLLEDKKLEFEIKQSEVESRIRQDELDFRKQKFERKLEHDLQKYKIKQECILKLEMAKLKQQHS